MHTAIRLRTLPRTKAPTSWLALAAMCLAAPACGGGSSSGASGQTICTDGATPAGAAQVGALQLAIPHHAPVLGVNFGTVAIGWPSEKTVNLVNIGTGPCTFKKASKPRRFFSRW